VQLILDIARISITLAFLVYASFSDYMTREVSNRVWMVFAPVTFVLTFTELFIFEPSQLLFYGISFGLTSAFAIILFYSGGFGGADAKALMCLALALPFYPGTLLAPISRQISPISETFFPVSVFSNSVLFAAATAVYMLLRNVYWRQGTGRKLFGNGLEGESIGRKTLVMITGYKVSISKLKDKWHLYPMEDAEEDAENKLRRKLLVVPKDEGRDAIVSRLSKATEEGTIQNAVWATPGLPMLIFITAGLIVALVVGDIVWIGIRFLLG
jgi:preflagellin peptidase FlaK